MRLLNSICKVLSQAYAYPIYIEDVPQGFERPSFFVTRVTDTKTPISRNTYRDNPMYQIIYFGEKDEANQVIADKLYLVQDKLDELFLLSLAVPVITQEGERQRYAKVDSFSSNLRLDEGAIYCNITLNFTEAVPRFDNYETMQELDFGLSVRE